MTPETKEALEESIKHWEENLERYRIGWSIITGPKECALCRKFNLSDTIYPCVKCPIFNKTGLPFCKETPYDIFARSSRSDWKEKHIIAEIDFLKSLREEERS